MKKLFYKYEGKKPSQLFYLATGKPVVKYPEDAIAHYTEKMGMAPGNLLSDSFLILDGPTPALDADGKSQGSRWLWLRYIFIPQYGLLVGVAGVIVIAVLFFKLKKS